MKLAPDLDTDALRGRINRIIGQLNGVQRMIDQSAACEDILVQLNAANGALHRVGLMVLEGHLRHCVLEGVEHGNAEAAIGNFSDALEHFSRFA